MAWTGLTLTVDGRYALNQAQLSKKINFKSIVVGDGKTPENFSTLKGLIHQLYEVTDLKIDVVEGGCTITADFPKVDYDYYFREIGVIVTTPDGDKLYVYDNCGNDAQYVISSTGVETTQKRLRLSLKISDINEITVSSPSILYVAYDDFEQAMDVLKENKSTIEKHIENNIIHVTTEDKTKWNEEIGEKTVTFTQATNRGNLSSGEKLKISLGKIKKWFADLKTVAFTGSYSDLSNKPTIPAAVRVKGNAESTYRVGDVNVTPENIGALPASGGTLTGDLRIKGSGNYGTKINLGDGDYVHFSEPTDDCLEVKAKKINFLVSDTTDEKFTLNGEKIGAKADKATKADEAIKATKDAEGNVITDSYAVRKIITEGDFNDITTPGLYTMRQTSGNKPNSGASYYGLLVLQSDNGNYIEQLAFRESSYEVYIRTCSGSNWTAWEKFGAKADKLATARTIDGVTFDGSANISHYAVCSAQSNAIQKDISIPNFNLTPGARVTVNFLRENVVDEPVLEVNGNEADIVYRTSENSFNPVGNFGCGSYDFVYNGTFWEMVQGAVVAEKMEGNDINAIAEVYSGFKYIGGIIKNYPFLKLSFISITFQATVETGTGNNITVCRMQKSPSVNTALSARVSRNIGAINAVIFTGGNLSIATDRAIPADGYILCSGIYSFT